MNNPLKFVSCFIEVVQCIYSKIKTPPPPKFRSKYAIGCPTTGDILELIYKISFDNSFNTIFLRTSRRPGHGVRLWRRQSDARLVRLKTLNRPNDPVRIHVHGEKEIFLLFYVSKNPPRWGWGTAEHVNGAWALLRAPGEKKMNKLTSVD